MNLRNSATIVLVFTLSCTYSQAVPVIKLLKYLQVYAIEHRETHTGYENVELPVKGVREGYLHTIKVEVKTGSIHDEFIRKSLEMEVIYGRGHTGLLRTTYVGLDELNASGIFEEFNEISEAGDLIVIDLIPSREVIKIPIVSDPRLDWEHVISEAQYRNVYYGNTEIEMYRGSINGADLVRNGSTGENGKLKLKGYIHLNNCKFDYGNEVEGRKEVVLLDSISLSALTINNSSGLNLYFKHCRIDKFEVTDVTGESLYFTNNDINQFNLNGTYDEVKVEENTFNPTTNEGKIGFAGHFGTLSLAKNKLKSVRMDLNQLTVNNKLKIADNSFYETTISMEDFRFPTSSSELLWDQFAGYRLEANLEDELSSTVPNAKGDSAAGKGVDLRTSDLSDAAYRRKVRAYQKLFNYYKEIGDIESANSCYVEQKKVEGERLHRIYVKNGGFNNLISWRQNQLTKTVSMYGTDVPRAIIITTCMALLVFGSVWRISKLRSKNRKPGEKRLAVLVFSDIVGYTAMMGNDEKKAMKTLSINRTNHQLLTKRFNGELLKEMGDGMLCSFSTASDAVNFCINMQRDNVQRKEFQLRMGVHLGEVSFSKGDVFGDGVNIASRLEHEARDGGIYISETVYQNIRNQKEIVTEFVGERELKNVVSKVKMYEVKY